MKGVSSKHLQSSARTCQALEAPIPWVFETKKSSQLCGFRGWEGPPSSTHLTPPGAGSNESSPAQTRTSLLLPVIAEMPKMAFAAPSCRIIANLADWRLEALCGAAFIDFIQAEGNRDKLFYTRAICDMSATRPALLPLQRLPPTAESSHRLPVIDSISRNPQRKQNMHLEKKAA